jgi:hypothetical protein
MQLQISRPVRRKAYPQSNQLDEQMDMARYKCRIFHMYSILCHSIYDDLIEYRNMVARKNPSVAFIKPLDSGNFECLVYIFETLEYRNQFLEENPNYNKLYKLTKERKFL